ncbi:DUF167 domain-containing protein [Candidatus Peregrinibacteria bacterium]|nr:DUF167 domain-containing protein [Candidatus Peregrinibacteria bacterium]
MIDTLRARLAKEGTITFTVRVHPAAKETKISGVLDDGSVKVSVRAPADKGKANHELIRFLATAFDVPPSGVSLLSGSGQRLKIVKILRP